MKPKIIVLVGPPGSGKSTYAKNWLDDNHASSDCAKKIIISQDTDGKKHLEYFKEAISRNKGTYDILIDRMNFNKEQRERYIKPARDAGYETEIVVLHESRDACIARGLKRLITEHHETINTEDDLRNAINFFFSKYERPTEDEADIVTFKYPERDLKLDAIICDIDGTAANIDHRLHYVQGPGKKDWGSFFRHLDKDIPNLWCRNILTSMRHNHIVVMCSGRPDNYKQVTETWLRDNKFFYDHLFMRPRNDHRDDATVKEIILHFELLTRFNISFSIDDRRRVVDMWRKNDITCLACAHGEF